MSPTGRWAVGMMSPVTIITFRMRKKTQLSHWPESVHSNTLQTRSSPTPPRQLWLQWNIGKWQSFHHCLAIQRYQNWQVQKNRISMQCIIPKENVTHTQCPHISRMLLFEKGLMFGVRTFPTFHLREFLLWEHVGHRSPPPAGSSQEPDPTSISLTAWFQGQVCSHYQATSFTRESSTCSTRASTPCLPFIIVRCSLQYLEMGLEEMQPLLAVRCDVWNP